MLKTIGLRLFCFFLTGNIAEGKILVDWANVSLVLAIILASFIVSIQ